MANPLEILWRRLSDGDFTTVSEVKRIAVLQQTAVRRRAEYEEEEKAVLAGGNTSPSHPLLYSQKRMKQAEAAHAAALQVWENKQSRQKSY